MPASATTLLSGAPAAVSFTGFPGVTLKSIKTSSCQSVLTPLKKFARGVQIVSM